MRYDDRDLLMIVPNQTLTCVETVPGHLQILEINPTAGQSSNLRGKCTERLISDRLIYLRILEHFDNENYKKKLTSKYL